MSGKIHGRGAVLKLDDLGGSIQDISTYADKAGYNPKTDRPETQTFGEIAKRRQVLGLRDGSDIPIHGPLQILAMGGSPPAQALSGKLHGRNTKLLIDALNLGTFFKKGSIKRTIDLPETQTFGDAWKERDVTGLLDGSVNLNGFYDSVANGPEATVRAALGASVANICTLGLNGFAIGATVDMFQAFGTSESWPSDENSVTELNVDFVTDDVIDIGVSLHDVITAETAVVNFAGVDEVAATTQGGVGQLHMTSFSGTTVTIKIQHSTDNSVWNDLITFVAMTAVGVQRIAVSGTVNRYVRAIISAATITTINFVAAFGRRGYLSSGVATGSYRHWVGMLQSPGTSPASFTAQYGPEGSTTGARRYSGETRTKDVNVTFDENAVTTFDATLTVTGTVTEDTWP